MSLLLWPAAPSRSEQNLPGLVAWQPRGDLAADAAVLRSLASAWRSAASASDIPAPGTVVEPLFVGEPDGYPVALLRSVGDTGRVLVAAASAEQGDWRLLDAVPVDREVPWLTVPGDSLPRVLTAPDVQGSAAVVLRRDDGVWNRVAIRDDGVSATLRSLDPQSAVVGVIRRQGETRGLVDVSTISATSILPLNPPVVAESPRWGRATSLSPEEYDSALYAAPALYAGSAVPGFAGSLAVLASTRTPGGRLVLVEAVSADDGQARHLLVVPGWDGSARLGPAPRVSNQLAVAAVPREQGRVAVLAAAAPSIARVEVRDSTGRTYVDGIGPTAVVLATPTPDEIVVLGKRTNGSVVASIRLPLDVD